MPAERKTELHISEAAFDAPELGRRLRAARAKAGVTRRQLAEASGASERYLAQIEAGEGNPSLAVTTAIAHALDLAPAEILPLGGERDGAREAVAARVRRLSPDRLRDLLGWLDGHPAEGSRAQRVVLIGLRGAGKSSLGREVASRLGMPFIDLSKEVEKSYGASIGVLIELGGQAALRRQEAELWDSICAANRRAVIAAPGGIVADGPLFERVLASAHSVWLQARPEDHMARVMQQGDLRPMSSNRSAMEDLKAILDARSADYGRADASLDTSAQDFPATVAALERMIRSLLMIDHAI